MERCRRGRGREDNKQVQGFCATRVARQSRHPAVDKHRNTTKLPQIRGHATCTYHPTLEVKGACSIAIICTARPAVLRWTLSVPWSHFCSLKRIGHCRTPGNDDQQMSKCQVRRLDVLNDGDVQVMTSSTTVTCIWTAAAVTLRH